MELDTTPGEAPYLQAIDFGFSLDLLPVGQDQVETWASRHRANLDDLLNLRAYTNRVIESKTHRPLLVYIAKTEHIPELPGIEIDPGINDGDVDFLVSLIDSLLERSPTCTSIDFMLVSNGGYPTSAERMVMLLREAFQSVRFILPGNAFSAATMMAMSADEILMTESASLGPIDPQIGGVPAHTILEGVRRVREILKEEGADALPGYLHSIADYPAHFLEICQNAIDLSNHLAKTWLSDYMFRDNPDTTKIDEIVGYFGNHYGHLTHNRSINFTTAKTCGLKVVPIGRSHELYRPVRSLYSQASLFLDRTPFYKLYEDGYGTSAGQVAGQIIAQPATE